MLMGTPRLLFLLLLVVLQGRWASAGVCPPAGPEEPLPPPPPFDALYAAGVEAHSRGAFGDAVRYLEGALRAYRCLRETRLACGLRCRRDAPLQSNAAAAAPASLLRRAHCLRACPDAAHVGPPSRHRASEDVRADFQRRVPYSYLQRAYIQVRDEGASRLNLGRQVGRASVGSSLGILAELYMSLGQLPDLLPAPTHFVAW